MTKLKQLWVPAEFRLPEPEFSKEQLDLLEELIELISPSISRMENATKDERLNMANFLVELGTGIWRIRRKIEGLSRMPKEIRDALYSLESMWMSMSDGGVEIVDHIGTTAPQKEAKVLEVREIPNLTREQVIDAIKPTILLRGEVVQLGEVIIGKPASSASSAFLRAAPPQPEGEPTDTPEPEIAPDVAAEVESEATPEPMNLEPMNEEDAEDAAKPAVLEEYAPTDAPSAAETLPMNEEPEAAQETPDSEPGDAIPETLAATPIHSQDAEPEEEKAPNEDADMPAPADLAPLDDRAHQEAEGLEAEVISPSDESQETEEEIAPPSPMRVRLRKASRLIASQPKETASERTESAAALEIAAPEPAKRRPRRKKAEPLDEAQGEQVTQDAKTEDNAAPEIAAPEPAKRRTRRKKAEPLDEAQGEQVTQDAKTEDDAVPEIVMPAPAKRMPRLKKAERQYAAQAEQEAQDAKTEDDAVPEIVMPEPAKRRPRRKKAEQPDGENAALDETGEAPADGPQKPKRARAAGTRTAGRGRPRRGGAPARDDLKKPTEDE
jgi:hypothetical protein